MELLVHARRAGASVMVITLVLATPVAAQVAPGAVAGAAGSVVGTVRDGESGEPLPATTVRLLEAHRTELVRGDGRFAFDGLAPGGYTLIVERIGYRTESRSVEVGPGEAARVDITLSVAAVQLDEVIVAGAISERSARDLLSAASVIAGAALDRETGATVAETVRNEPGVAVASAGPATARPVIRGLGGDRILLLEDGQRPGDLSATSGDHAVAVEPLTATRFEVVRGPLSLLYGSSAMGGVVNVVREEIPGSVPEHVHGVVSSQTVSGTRGLALGGQVTAGLGSVSFRGEASARAAGDVRTPAGELPNTELRAYGFAGGVAYVRDHAHAGASYRFHTSEYGIPAGAPGLHEGGVRIDMRRHTLRGQFELHPVDPAFVSNATASLGYTDYRHVELESNGLIGTRFDQRLASGDVVLRHGAGGVFAQGAVGFRAQYRDIHTGGSLRTPSTHDVSLATFVVEEIGTGPLRFEVGARYDWAHYSPHEPSTIRVGGEEVPVRARTFGSFAGAFGVLYAIREDLRVGASVSRAYRTPDFNELYSDGPHLAAHSYDVGDPELGQETGIGIDVFARFGGERFQAEVAAFRNELANYIFPSSRGRVERGPQRGRPRLQYTNQDARFTGVEGGFDWTMSPSWIVHGTASYVRAEFVGDRPPIPVFVDPDTVLVPASRYPPLIPPLHGRVGVRYETPGRFAGLDVRWAGRQDRIGDFEEPTAGYAVLDLSAGVRLLWRDRLHTLTLGVDNALDTEYRDHLSRTKAVMPEPGRSLSLLYRLSF